jgi:prolipoprotein diacylglyceryltransferase
MAVLLFVIRRFSSRLFAGDAALMYIMWYGTVRTLLENYRVENWTILGVPTAIWIGVIAVVLSAAWVVYRHRRGSGSPMVRPAAEREPETPPPAAQPEATAG